MDHRCRALIFVRLVDLSLFILAFWSLMANMLSLASRIPAAPVRSTDGRASRSPTPGDPHWLAKLPTQVDVK